MIPQIIAEYLKENGIPVEICENPGIHLTDLYINKDNPTIRLTICHIVPTEAYMVCHHSEYNTRIIHRYDLNEPQVFEQLLHDIRNLKK